MDNAIAFKMGEANRHKELMVFDWDKAAKLIKESTAQYACAGLRQKVYNLRLDFLAILWYN